MRNLISAKLLLGFSLFGLFSQSYATTYPISKGQEVVGDAFVVRLQPGDSLDSLATRYDMSVHEVLEANPFLGSGVLRVGQKVVIPARFILPKKEYRKNGGIVINISELRLYHFSRDGRFVTTYPVALGRKGWRTPTTASRVVRKAVNPDWHVSNSIKRYHYKKFGRWLPSVIRGGTGANPLGGYAMYLSKPGIILHGTNFPMSIGKFVSSGCIRLSPKNVQALYHHVTVGTPVYIVHHAHKAGWVNGELYMESHVPVSMNEKRNAMNHTSQEQVIKNAIGKRVADIHWEKVHQVATQKRGVPQVVGRLISDSGL